MDWLGINCLVFYLRGFAPKYFLVVFITSWTLCLFTALIFGFLRLKLDLQIFGVYPIGVQEM